MAKPLVNCHTHLELGWLADLCPAGAGEPFTDWIARLVLRRRAVYQDGEGEKLTRQAVEDGIQRLLDSGVTHVGDISSHGLSVEPLLDSGLAGVVYVEVIGSNREQGLASFEVARAIVEKHRPRERNGLRLGLSPHAPYSTHPDVFRTAASYCLREDVPLCIHLAESPYERQALVGGDGPFFELSRRIGTTPPPAPGLGPVAYLESLGVLEARPLLVHMVQASDEELDLVAGYGAKIAHCPRSNRLLQCGRMPLEKMLARGIPVALGTDSLASSPSLDVREEAEAAVALHKHHVNEQVIYDLLQANSIFGDDEGGW
ncbi:MAG: amidohydrolase family protein [Chloroflexi bacterium]|nr:amidohydrolase family protein [Chloroflexota bacterium]MCI0643662.1 amidohydrolase family protein [Chloroflexota bacterium]